MTKGDLWWARSDSTATANIPGTTVALTSGGLELSGTLVGPPAGAFPVLPIKWVVTLSSYYFLDPPRMPASGDPFISQPKLTISGGLGLAGGEPGKEWGVASCAISLTQILKVDNNEVARAVAPDWIVGYVSGTEVILGNQILPPGQRDFLPLFFNLDRGKWCSITLLTTITLTAYNFSVIGFAPVVFGIPQWSAYSLDS
jgi:hypothetical protein